MEQQCSGQVNKREKTWGVSFQPCKKIGVLKEDGRWWCRTHPASLKKALQENTKRSMTPETKTPSLATALAIYKREKIRLVDK